MKFFKYSQLNSGSSFVSPALGVVGQGRLNINNNFPPKKIGAKPKQAGKKKRGSGGNEFLPACSVPRSGTGGGKRLVLASARKQSQKKLFPFRRIFCARPLKELIIFSGFAYRRQAASRWAGYAPVRAQSSARKRFELRPVNATIQDFWEIWKRLIARSAPQGRGYARIFPYISALNQRAGEARTGLFCPAGGGSWWQSHQSKSHFVKRLLNAFAFQFFPPLAEGKRTKQVLIPRFTLRLWRSGQRRQLLT